MKKRVLVGLAVSIAILGYFYPTKQENIVKKSVDIWETQGLPIEKKIAVAKKRENNSSTINQKPTVDVYGFNIASVGDSIKIKSDAQDKDGNITKYIWKLDGKVLSSEPQLSFVFSKEGEHTFTLYVTDNLGATAHDSISVDVFAQADKKVFYKHRSCGCESVYYTYYNSDGNISKEISQGMESIEIKEYSYDSEGHLIQEHLKEYIKDGAIQRDITIVYDAFGNQIERFGKEVDYATLSDLDKLVSVEETTVYNKEHKLLEEITRKDNQITSVKKNSYYADGKRKESRFEEYKDGVVKTVSIDTNLYDESGNEIKEIRSTEDIETNTKEVYITEKSYSQSGNILTEKSYQNGKLNRSHLYEYNSENRVNKEVVNSQATYYTYNDKGFITSEKKENGDGSMTLELSKYNEQGQQIEIKIDQDGDGFFEEKKITEYDENGKQLSYREELNGELNSYSLYHNGEFQESGRASGYTKRYIIDANGRAVALLTNYDGQKTRTEYRYNSSGERIEERDENGNILYSMELKDEK